MITEEKWLVVVPAVLRLLGVAHSVESIVPAHGGTHRKTPWLQLPCRCAVGGGLTKLLDGICNSAHNVKSVTYLTPAALSFALTAS
jgi:hypothetical protein